jgi:hypothetical protein
MPCRWFSRFFCSIYWFSVKIIRFLTKFTQKSPRQFSGKSSIYQRNWSINRQTSRILVFLIYTVPPSSPVRFGRIFLNFSKTDRIAQVRFSSFRRIFKHWWEPSGEPPSSPLDPLRRKWPAISTNVRCPFQIFSNFIIFLNFFKNRQNHSDLIFLLPPNFRILLRTNRGAALFSTRSAGQVAGHIHNVRCPSQTQKQTIMLTVIQIIILQNNSLQRPKGMPM